MNSKQYSNVVLLDKIALKPLLKPLFLIIYESEHAGMYELVCSKELTEIIGFDFSTENDAAGWRKFERIFKDVYQQNYWANLTRRKWNSMIDWKKIKKIDAHIHLMPPDVIEANKEYGGNFIDFGDVRDYLEIMDKYNIESAFIMPFNDPYMLSMDFNVCTVHNNLFDMCGKAKNRLFCFADIDIRNDLERTIQILEDVVKREEVLGLKIHATNTAYPIDGMYYDEIFKWANKNNILVEIHSYPRIHLMDDVCSPARIKNVIKKYPKLRISIAHIGGFQYEELIGLGLFFNISAILPDLVDKYGIEDANKILRRLDVEKLIFATDYPDNRKLEPSKIYDKYFEILSKMDFSEEEAEKICRLNALEMINKYSQKTS